MKTKKLINDPKVIIEEMLEGIVAAHPKHVRQLPDAPRAVIAVNGPRKGKVGLVIGGGSGHEPTFVGFVGKGLADACPIGNVFASPPPDPIYACTKAASGGAGVLFMYGNYAGDVMNFDMAAEMAGMDDIEIRTVLTTDDIASAPIDQKEKRRGVAGNFFIFKIAGAACDTMKPLDECERLARKANAHTYTMGVCLSPCSLPQTQKYSFELGPDEMEIGMGIHGEPGVAKGPIQTADAVTDTIMDRILGEMKPKKGDKVAVLVNSLGSTPLMELYLLNRRVKQRPRCGGGRDPPDLGRKLLHLAGDGGRFHQPAASRRGADRSARSPLRLRHVPGGLNMGEINAAGLIAIFKAIGDAIEADKGRLSELDGVIGDADHGVTMSIGFTAVNEALAKLEPSADPTAVFNTAAKSFLNAVGASSGPLYGTAFMRAGGRGEGQGRGRSRRPGRLHPGHGQGHAGSRQGRARREDDDGCLAAGRRRSAGSQGGRR